jgi:uncharacterized protein (TIGR01777 family)
MEKILITGASGLLGTRLTEIILTKGYQVVHLGRGVKNSGAARIQHFTWDIDKEFIDPEALKGVTAIIHLAGAGVADKRWTKERKREIIESRVKSAELIHKTLKNTKHSVKTFVSASAVGYYGDCGKEVIKENHLSGDGFLADVCCQWEEGAMNMALLGLREVRCRIGIVLAKNGGALPELVKTIPLGVAPYFAKNNLYYPWVHIDDVCGIMLHAIENDTVNGAYNTTAPKPLLIKELMHDILTARKSSALLVPTPPLAIKLALGEMSEMVLSSQRCSADKILATGYQFKYTTALKALKDIYKK